MYRIFFLIAVVFAFLAGFVVAEADWFKPAKESLYAFLRTLSLRR